MKTSKLRFLTCDQTAMSALTWPVIIDYFSYLAEKDEICLALAILFVTTNLHPKRPWLLSSNNNEVNSPEIVLLHVRESVLSYGVLRGATDKKGKQINKVSEFAAMQLHLPKKLHLQLCVALSKKKLTTLLGRLDAYAAQFSWHHAGQTPTVERLRKSCDDVFAYDLSELQQSTLAGMFRARLGAMGYYPKVDLGQINIAYHTAFHQFCEKLGNEGSPALQNYLSDMYFESEIPSGWVGSQINVSESDMSSLLRTLRQRTKEAFQAAHTSEPGERLRHMIDAYQFQHIYLYFIQQLCFIMRPIGPLTQVSVMPAFGIYIREKDSAHHIERRVIPIPNTWIKQHAICQKDLAALFYYSDTYRFTLDKHAFSKTDPLAQHFIYNAKKHSLSTKRMEWSDVKKHLREYGIETTEVLANVRNATRHFMANQAHQHLPSVLVEECMGHQSAGRELTNPWATTSKDAFDDFNVEIDSFLSTLIPPPLRLHQSDLLLKSLPRAITGALYNPQRTPAEKSVRPSIFPGKVKTYAQLEAVSHLLSFVQKRWVKRERTADELELALLIILSSQGSLHGSALSLLTYVTIDDVIPKWGFNVPLHPFMEDRDDFTELPLPKLALPLLKKLVAARKNNNKGNHLFRLLKFKSRQLVWENLLPVYRALRKEFIQACPDLIAPRWGTLLSLAPLFAWQAGMPPWAITQLSRYPLPAPITTGSAPLVRMPMTQPAGIIQTNITKREKFSATVDFASYEESNWDSIRNWSGQACRVLQTLVAKLTQIETWNKNKKYFTSIRQKRHAQTAFQHAFSCANRISPSNRTALHLLLSWIYSKYSYHSGSIRPATFNNYLLNVAYKGLLGGDADTIDLQMLDSDDFIEILEQRLDQENFADSSIDSITSTFADLYTFAMVNEFTGFIDLSELKNITTYGTTRQHLIDSSEFETAIQHLMVTDPKNNLKVVVMACLAFYAGMRPNELARLSCADVYGTDDCLVIEVVCGKTINARRRLYFDTLGSPLARKYLLQYIDKRNAEFRMRPERSLRAISFFGITYRDEFCKPAFLSGQISTILRGYFGEGFVTYYLRHAAASWLFLRWYALRHPEVLETLHCRQADIFSAEAQARLAHYFHYDRPGVLPKAQPSDLYVLARTLGHALPRTTFMYYIHTFYFVYEHMRSKLDDYFAQVKKRKTFYP